MKIDFCPSCGFRLEVRSSEQNKLLHSRIQDIAKQVKWAGEYRDVETWKRLFVAAYEREKGNAPMILPAIDGHGMDFVFSRTHRMSKQMLSDLADFITVWGHENAVQFSDMPPLEIA